MMLSSIPLPRLPVKWNLAAPASPLMYAISPPMVTLTPTTKSITGRLKRLMRCRMLTKIMAANVPTKLVTMQGIMMSAGLAAPIAAR
jgi:hypothetical protein